ncbi:MAG: sugar phosphate isomerase/epimerase [Spirochaetales bacterium]|nr:sugar phosphate isomerase/epimerase [Spirochaetales bacterium]
MKLSITTAFSNKGSLENKIEAIAGAGFTHISIDDGLTENLIHCGEKRIAALSRLLIRNRLSVDWIHSPFRNIRLYTRDMKTWTQSIAKILQTITLAGKLNARSVIVHAFDTITAIPDNLHMSMLQLKNAVELLLDAAYKAGVYLALENLIESYMNNIIINVINAFSEIGLCLDTGHAEISGSWPVFLYTDILSRLVALHIHDNHGITDEHLILGDGQIDFCRHIKTIYESGYDGVWGIECIQDIGKFKGTPVTIAEKASSNLKHILLLCDTLIPARYM